MKFFNEQAASRRKGGKWAAVLIAAVTCFLCIQNAQAEASDADVLLEEVVVTGSRISRSTFDTPTPMTVLTSEMIAATGYNNIGDVLKETPEFGQGFGTTNSWYENDVGAQFVSLRGLGAQRTLVLIDGRRRVAGTQSSSAVDLSTIPANMVERIEIITGGASAVYGADAVTGVVNIILKKDAEGAEFSFRTGMNEDGDAQTTSIGVFTGTAFAEDRGSISFGMSYNTQDPLFLRERDDLLPLLRPDRNPNAPPSNITYSDWRVPLLEYSGAFYLGSDLYTVDPDLQRLENDVWFGGALAYGGSACYCPADFNQLRFEQDVLSVLTKVDYEIVDNVSFFAEANLSNSDTKDHRVPTTTYFTPIYRDNPFIPDDLGAVMDDMNLDQIQVSRAHVDHGIQVGDVERSTFTIAAGFRGELAETWEWQGYYQYGEYNQELQTLNSHITSHLLEATDVILDPVTGEPVCRSAEARARGCLPLNILGSDVATQEALDYVKHTRVLNVETDQMVIGASIVNDAVFELPAGGVGLAAGFEYREESLSAIDDPLAQQNLLFIDDNGGPPISASSDVTEFYVETVVPVLSGVALADSLEFEGAVRFSDYSTIGSTTAWKIGASWAPSSSYRIRTTLSESVRAPSLAELYSPGFNSSTSVMDPCDATRIGDSPNRAGNCEALGLPFIGWVDQLAIGRQVFIGGNPDIEEETSNSFTMGLVLTPESIDGFRLAVDYWDIDIDDAINTLPLQQVLERCVDLDSIDNPFCPLIQRAPTFEVARVNLSPINIGNLTARGVDFQLAYDTDAPFSLPGGMTYRVNGTYLIELEELVDASNPDTLIVKDGTVSDPDWRINASVVWANGPYRFDLDLRYIDGAVLNYDWTPEQYDRLSAPSRIYTDVLFTYEFSERFSGYLGINNLFETNPPRVASLEQGLNTGGYYDNIGRYFFVGGDFRF